MCVHAATVETAIAQHEQRLQLMHETQVRSCIGALIDRPAVFATQKLHSMSRG